jgi:hypothetical protein
MNLDRFDLDGWQLLGWGLVRDEPVPNLYLTSRLSLDDRP